MSVSFLILFFFFNDTATTEIYTLSLHDALPISFHGWLHQSEQAHERRKARDFRQKRQDRGQRRGRALKHVRGIKVDRKSTRLNSSHQIISYAVFCLKKKKKERKDNNLYDGNNKT